MFIEYRYDNEDILILNSETIGKIEISPRNETITFVHHTGKNIGKIPYSKEILDDLIIKLNVNSLPIFIKKEIIDENNCSQLSKVPFFTKDGELVDFNDWIDYENESYKVTKIANETKPMVININDPSSACFLEELDYNKIKLYKPF